MRQVQQDTYISEMHVRHYLIIYLLVIKDGKFIIRIEDTDVKRNVAGGEESQIKYLRWLGIDWDESVDVGGEYGPYRQIERLDIYKKLYKDLLEHGLAYKCYMTEEELEVEREGQIARGETPRYAGNHRELTEEQVKRFEAEGRIPSIRFRVPESVNICLMIS